MLFPLILIYYQIKCCNITSETSDVVILPNWNKYNITLHVYSIYVLIYIVLYFIGSLPSLIQRYGWLEGPQFSIYPSVCLYFVLCTLLAFIEYNIRTWPSFTIGLHSPWPKFTWPSFALAFILLGLSSLGLHSLGLNSPWT